MNRLSLCYDCAFYAQGSAESPPTVHDHVKKGKLRNDLVYGHNIFDYNIFLRREELDV